MSTPCTPRWFLEEYPSGQVPNIVLNACANALASNRGAPPPNPVGGSMAGTPNPVSGGFTTIGGRRRGGGRIIGGYTPSPFEGGRDPFGGGGGGGGGGGINLGGDNTLVQIGCAIAGIPAEECSIGALTARGIDIFTGGGGGGGSLPNTGLDVGGGNGNGSCPDGAIRVGDKCIVPGDIFPGGDPGMVEAGGTPVRGLYGAGFSPTTESRQVRRCPPGFVLGKDNVCYDHLPRSKRKWDPGMKPLMTGGDRAAIRKAATAARKLKRAKKQLKKSARALEKVS